MMEDFLQPEGVSPPENVSMSKGVSIEEVPSTVMEPLTAELPQIPIARTSRTESTSQIERIEGRFELTLESKIFTVGGSRTVTFFDLSANGCCFRDTTNSLKANSPISVKLAQLNPIPSKVRWAENGPAGAQFENPLYPSVLDHIRQNFDLRQR